MHGSMRRVRQKFAETEMNRHFGKTLATHFHVINTNTRFTYIHQTTTKLHIYIKPQASITYTSNHKLDIYIKRLVSHTHIHQTTSFIYTYTSNRELFLHKRRKMEEMGDINGRKELGRRY